MLGGSCRAQEVKCLQLFNCPNCDNQAIPILSFFWGMGGVKNRICRSCGQKLKVNLSFYGEFFAIFLISGLIFQYAVSSLFYGESHMPNSLEIALSLLALVPAYSPVWIFTRRIFYMASA